MLRQRIRSPRQEWRRAVGGVMTQPGLRGLGDTPRRFAGFALRQPADNPLADIEAATPDLRGDRLFREIEERWNCRGIHHRRRRIPLRNSKNFRAVLAESGEKANTELLVPRSMPMLKLGCAISCPWATCPRN